MGINLRYVGGIRSLFLIGPCINWSVVRWGSEHHKDPGSKLIQIAPGGYKFKRDWTTSSHFTKYSIVNTIERTGLCIQLRFIKHAQKWFATPNMRNPTASIVCGVGSSHNRATYQECQFWWAHWRLTSIYIWIWIILTCISVVANFKKFNRARDKNKC